MEWEVRKALTKESCGFFTTREEAWAWINAHDGARWYDLVPVGEYRRFDQKSAMLATACREILAARGL